MYEQAFRLLHLNTVEALEKQVKCYLAAKNVLHLCKPEFAWAVRPTDPEEEVEEVILEPLAGSKKVTFIVIKTCLTLPSNIVIECIHFKFFSSFGRRWSRFYFFRSYKC